MNLFLKKHNLSHLRTIVLLNISLNNINPKLTFVQSIIVVKYVTTNTGKLKTGFSKVKERISNF